MYPTPDNPRPRLATRGLGPSSQEIVDAEVERLKLQIAVLTAERDQALDLLRQAMGMRI